VIIREPMTDTVAEGAKQAPLTVTHDGPTFYRCRWNIAPTKNNTGAYLSVKPVRFLGNLC
jgi:hypothetical protein